MHKAIGAASAGLLLLLLLVAMQPADASSLADSVLPFYQAMEGFLDFIQPSDKSVLLNEVLPMLINGTISQLVHSNWMDTSRHFVLSTLGFAILVCIGVFLIIVVPIVGCCVCCCRCCCGNCGGRLSYMERKGSVCRRGCCGFLHLLFTTAILFGAVLALVSNQLLHDQLASPRREATAIGTFSSAVYDIAGTLDETPQRGREATPKALSDSVDKMLPSLNRTLGYLQAELANGSATDADGSLAAARVALNSLAAAQTATSDYVAGHAGYAASLAALNDTMGRVRQNLTTPENFTCPGGAASADCQVVRDALPELRLARDPSAAGHDQLADLGHRLGGQNASQLALRLDAAQAALDNITAAGMEMLTKALAESQAALNSSQLMQLWDRLAEPLSNAAEAARRFSNLTDIRVFNPLTRAQEPLASTVSYFDAYRYYAYIAVACFALLLVTLFYLGLLYGCAGEPPYEDSGCCNRGVGARFLLAGAGLGYLFYAGVMLIVMLLFLTGGAIDTEACRYLSGRAANGYAILDDVAVQALRSGGGVGGGSLNLSLLLRRPASVLLSGCAGGSITDAVDLAQVERVLELSATLERYLNQTKVELARRGADFMSGVSLNISQLSEVQLLARNASALNVSAFEAELRKSLTAGSLSVLLAALQNISRDASDASSRSRFSDLHDALNGASGAAASSTASQLVLLARLPPTFAQLNASIAEVPGRLAAANAALRSPDVLLAAIQSADNRSRLSQELLAEAQSAMGRLLTASLDCGRLGASLRRAIAVPCVDLLRPYNGYWAGMGLCLVCLLPCLVLAIKLANLYRKEQKYLKDLDDGMATNTYLTDHPMINWSFI